MTVIEYQREIVSETIHAKPPNAHMRIESRAWRQDSWSTTICLALKALNEIFKNIGGNTSGFRRLYAKLLFTANQLRTLLVVTI